jgi:hypothetical protein
MRGELVGVHYASSSTLKGSWGGVDAMVSNLKDLLNVSLEYHYNPSYIEGIGYGVGIDKYKEHIAR